ncbi:TonB-dependent receptor [Ferrimonas balearica DSM 9799]|uniref:TonB-dependent receptor n=1 Tax=Ferrimonas balearica (strain DSM 9799 / CCM 4581 / KCTC 23876 / PAT) TaxID=550540 RepID=E1ST95_FERBD|nr:TonB-dependent receptor [Ferrimonas balearica]ADN77129.1 TonB-dependent receptor [Ferrimonas balearica DSM 9799]
MGSVKFEKQLLASSIAMILGAGTLMPATAMAEEAEANVERIEVRGIRASQQASLNEKRFSNSVVDAITAEDIGKFPDKNVAESLQRIPGVTIQRQFGEGASVSIRGAGDDLTLTTLNGQNVASTGWFVLEPAKRSFNYELLPSEIVGDLKVYKSSQADLLEGGVGGTVEVNTRKPLDLDSLSFFASAASQYQSDSDTWDPLLSALGSWKNDSETFGVMVSGVMQDRSLQRQGNEAFWEWGAGPVAFEQERERTALTATLQWAPTDRLNIVVNAIDMEMKANNTNYALWLTQGDTSWAGEPGSGAWDETSWIGGCGLCGGDAPGAGSGTQIAGPLNVAYYQARPREATMSSEVYDLQLEYAGDGYVFEFQVGDTSSTGGTDFEMVVDDGTGGTPIPGGRYDFTGGSQTWDLNGFDTAAYDPGSLNMGTGSNFNRTPKTDDETYVQADIAFEVELGVINELKFGGRYASHNTTSRRFDYIQDPNFNPSISTGDVNGGLIDVGADDYQILRVDDEALKAWARSSIIGETEDLGSYSEIDEDNYAVYAMASYDADGLRGNFGLRFVGTDATSTYYVDDVKGETSADYTEMLPSFNAAYDLTDDMILRFSAARVMARPQYVDMYVNPDVRGANDDVPNNQYWIVGNVGLKPFIANQYDLGVEWYFNSASMVSAALFRKDVSNFVTIQESGPYMNGEAGIDFGGELRPDELEWTKQEKSNGESATIEGLELQYQQDFDNGLGAIVNYTYTDTDTSEDTFTDGNPFLSNSSKHSYNVTGYYENDWLEVRLSYAWRDEYMIRETGSYGNRLHDDFGSLDLSARWHVTDYLDITLDAVNLTEESSSQFGNNAYQTDRSAFTNGFPAFEYQMARTVAVGAALRF